MTPSSGQRAAAVAGRVAEGRTPWWALAAAGLGTFAFQLLWMDPGLGLYDEPIVLFGADRVLRGDVPYRDFWALYPPASFWVLAALFELFGETAFVGRVFDAFVKSAIVAAVYAIVASFGRARVALVGAALALGLLVHLRNYGVPMFGAIAAGLAGLCLLRRVADGASMRVAATAGAAIAVSVLFRQDLGAYALFAAFAFAAALRVAPATEPARRRVLGALPMFGAGFAAVLVPAVAWLILRVPLADLAYSLVEVPLQIYPRVRALPFPSPMEVLREAVATGSPSPVQSLVVYLPLGAVAACVVFEAAAMRRRRSPVPDASSAFYLALLVLAVGYAAKGWVRVSPLQMGAGLLATILLVGALASRSPAPAVRNVTITLAVLGVGWLLAKPLYTAATRPASDPSALSVLGSRWGRVAGELCADRSVPRLRCLSLDADRTAVARYLLAHGSAGRRIYVGAGRHDKLFVNDIALYFVAEARAATRWHDLHPGVQTTEAIQRSMLAELVSDPPAFVVVDTRWDDEAEPNESASSSGVTLLDDHIRANFEPVFRAGEVTVLVPRARP